MGLLAQAADAARGEAALTARAKFHERARKKLKQKKETLDDVSLQSLTNGPMQHTPNTRTLQKLPWALITL